MPVGATTSDLELLTVHLLLESLFHVALLPACLELPSFDDIEFLHVWFTPELCSITFVFAVTTVDFY